MGMYCEVSVAPPVGEGTILLSGYSQLGRATANRISLEKAWHGLHYLLTGDVWEGHGPLAFLLTGGEQLGDDEESPIRRFTADETRQIHLALTVISDEILWSRFDATQMEEHEIYPGIWDEDEEDIREEYLDYFHELKKVVASAAQTNQGLLVTLG
jgi:Domain of unknown function (DUF1877)